MKSQVEGSRWTSASGTDCQVKLLFSESRVGAGAAMVEVDGPPVLSNAKFKRADTVRDARRGS
jgi:hypothetical protein